MGSKTDFQADIRHAKVFGSPGKHFSSAQDSIVQQKFGSQLQDDVAMRGEGDVDSKPILPAHILALTLDSGHLAFVYAKDSNVQGEVDFVVSMKKIDSKGVHPVHLGKSIAVDPKYACDFVSQIIRLSGLISWSDRERWLLPPTRTHFGCMRSTVQMSWNSNYVKGNPLILSKTRRLSMSKA